MHRFTGALDYFTFKGDENKQLAPMNKMLSSVHYQDPNALLSIDVRTFYYLIL